MAPTWIALGHSVDVRGAEHADSSAASILHAHTQAQEQGGHGAHQEHHPEDDAGDGGAPGTHTDTVWWGAAVCGHGDRLAACDASQLCDACAFHAEECANRRVMSSALVSDSDSALGDFQIIKSFKIQFKKQKVF